VPQTFDRSELLKLAKVGAATRVAQLRQELDQLFRSFPDLRTASAGAGRSVLADTTGAGRTRRRRGWNAAQRKAAADRMRKYWAARKAGSKSGKK
jgi:hypothetical protein